MIHHLNPSQANRQDNIPELRAILPLHPGLPHHPITTTSNTHHLQQQFPKLSKMAGLYPAPTNYITTVGEDGISRFHSSKTPTSIDPIPSFRVHYIYSTTNTPAGGPPVKDNADLKNYEEIAAVPQVHFPTAGGTGGCLIHVRPFSFHVPRLTQLFLPELELTWT